ncbi:uncharacterized protein FOBCDRAFT_276972 [Fusarium oxysporum Fo47]|uniref:uncharacterized protein n=1 Tax=Fusarium oxysporum Fo47 TaxID=660027 RepID=UPI0028698D19|nr:uncharacterized protein FOBCDRAFT_276972 [Fusarium oxysporum Fo47]QKD57336.2 hypothetical protein FOBCDRAFT_276972 [Fusarium oxysporum Fo47]
MDKEAGPSAEDNSRLRSRQIRRYHHKNQQSGPLSYADKITQADLEFAIQLAPIWLLEDCEEGELDYPPQWETLPKSLSFTLQTFRRNAAAMTAVPSDSKLEVYMVRIASLES